MSLGTYFIDLFANGIFPREKRVLPIRRTSVAILDRSTEESSICALQKTAKERKESEQTEDEGSQDVRVVRGDHMTPMEAAELLDISSAMGLSFVSFHANL